MIWLTFSLELLGLAGLALGMEAHQRTVFAGVLSARLRAALRLGAGLLIFVALATAIGASGAGLGFVEWMIGLGVTGFILSMLLSLPRDRKAAHKTKRPQGESCLIKIESQS